MFVKTVGLWGIRAAELEPVIARLPRKMREQHRFVELPAAIQLMAAEEFELLAIAPTATTEIAAPLPPCRLLLLPGTEVSLLRHCVASCVMSYGGSHKDSLTISSLDHTAVSLAILRELPTLSGGIVERQELQLTLRQNESALSILFRVGLLLVLGLPAEDLPQLLTHWIPSNRTPHARAYPSFPGNCNPGAPSPL